jgi:hypothetical protein
MTCPLEKQTLRLCTGDLNDTEHQETFKHIKKCPDCHLIFQDFQETEKYLKKRILPHTPKSLARDCYKRIEKEFSNERKTSAATVRFPFSRWALRPALQWALVCIIFISGLGLGKIIFAPPNWVNQYTNMIRRRISANKIDDSRFVRNYFLNVETFFLELANIDDPSKIDDEDWNMEMKIANQVLQKTRQMKHHAEEKDDTLYTLLTDIEMVLEDVINTPKQEFIHYCQSIQNSIQENHLMTKIHGFSS